MKWFNFIFAIVSVFIVMVILLMIFGSFSNADREHCENIATQVRAGEAFHCRNDVYVGTRIEW